MTTLRSWYAKGRSSFVARVAAIGAVAGGASWLFALAVYPLFGARRPDLGSLLFAVPRGALFGAVLALALTVYWDRRAARSPSPGGRGARGAPRGRPPR